MSKTDENLKIAFANESQTNIEYLAYAHKAMDEDLMEIAQLFREAAGGPRDFIHIPQVHRRSQKRRQGRSGKIFHHSL